MRKPVARTVLGSCLINLVVVTSFSAFAAEANSVEEIVSKHLDSIGTAQARAAVKNRVAQGTVHFRTVVGGVSDMDGRATLVSEQHKLHLLLKFDNAQYAGERFIFDGDKSEVAATTVNKVRSSFGQLIYTQDAILREGLFGGTLSTGWPLLNLDERKAKLDYRGKKKFDGKEAFELEYRPKKSSDMEMKLYFDPQTYRHVATVYTLNIATSLSRGTTYQGQAVESGDEVQARQQQNRYRLEERFGDFKTSDGITLPSHYDIHFARELQSGETTEFDWNIAIQQITQNLNMDPRNFQVK